MLGEQKQLLETVTHLGQSSLNADQRGEAMEAELKAAQAKLGGQVTKATSEARQQLEVKRAEAATAHARCSQLRNQRDKHTKLNETLA